MTDWAAPAEPDPPLGSAYAGSPTGENPTGEGVSGGSPRERHILPRLALSRLALPTASLGILHGPGGEGVLHRPSARGLLRQAIVPLAEGVVGPSVLFYIVLVTVGFEGALIGALGWSYLAIMRRLVLRQRVPGTLMLAAALLSGRTVLALATHSPFLYFVQPTASTALVAIAFLTSALVGRPIIRRLATDFCPFDPATLANPHLRRFFMRVSLLWAFVLLSNAGVVLWLLLESSLRAFVVERTLLSVGFPGAGIVVSIWWFLRAMRRAGITVRFGNAS